MTWGDRQGGGDSSAVQALLGEVKEIYSTQGAFAAVKGDGTVVAWGDPAFGGDSRLVQTQLAVPMARKLGKRKREGDL